MKTTENTERDAYLPMSLLNDNDLDIINNSNLSGYHRDVAVCYFMASRLIETTQITLDINKNFDGDYHRLESLADFLVENGKSHVAQNLLNPTKDV
tara:strand:- start:479 stop:766 length:288 start_codon:yes stop_codon:yes gene_type:complete